MYVRYSSVLVFGTELRRAFRLFDKHGDGAISTDELGSFMKSLGQFPSRDELNTMLKEIDIDGRWRDRWVCRYSSPQRARSSPC